MTYCKKLYLSQNVGEMKTPTQTCAQRRSMYAKKILGFHLAKYLVVVITIEF